jgi:S-adenosylmethionine decarboxylase
MIWRIKYLAKHESTYGRHATADVKGIRFWDIDNLEVMMEHCKKAIERSGANIEDVIYKKFQPQGMSILYLLSESHFSIHISPEYQFASMDCYTCSENCYPLKTINYMVELLDPVESTINQFERGI